MNERKRGIKMDFGENLALIGTAATILGVFLTIYAIVNNKTLKKERKLTREIIAEETRLTREVIKEITEMIKETIQYLGNLIVAEGDKTRRAIVS